jgi:phosphate transport system substrate-binding protein
LSKKAKTPEKITQERNMKKLALAFLAAMIVLGAFAGSASARDQIRIVGSSTVYPFASYVAEEFGATTKFKTPVIESTGSGGGHKLFSEGVGANTPDITNSSRRIKSSELERDMANGVKDIHEVILGYDGIAIAHNKDNPELNLTREELLLAVAAEVPQNGKLVPNPYTNWNQINPNLPNREIVIFGPPTTSGTRDAFEEMVMEKASKKIEAYGGKYNKVRQDGPYVPSGENDNLIVQKLAQNKDALGIFGYSFLAENQDRIQGALIEGVKPEPANISSGDYPISRSLFFYVKLAHIGVIPGIEEYVDMFLSEQMIGEKGYLKRIGLVPLPAAERDKQRSEWKSRQTMSMGDLK